MIDFRTPENVDESYPTVISAIEKDKIMEALITKANGREKVTLEYKEIKDLKISKDQFKMVIRQFKNIGLIENNILQFHQINREKNGRFVRFLKVEFDRVMGVRK